MITGHAKKDGTLHIDFESLVKLNGTLVFLMSLSSMEMILKGLINAGMDPEMPAAVLEKGTTAGQRRVVATVSTLKEESDRAGIGTPAMIVVGKVCTLADKLHWAEDRPLGGRQFLLTRPRQNMSVLADKLRKLGAQVIEMPAIRTEPIRSNERLGTALREFAEAGGEGWLVFTSPIGVDVFWEQLQEQKMDVRNIFCGRTEVKAAAIGTATAKALLRYGIMADLVPEVYSAGELGTKLARTAAEGARILIARAEKGSEELIPPLEEAGLAVEDIALYRTVYEVNPVLREEVERMIDAGEIDAVTFTSASTVHGFTEAMGEIDYGKIRAVCIGRQTALAAEQFGMNVEISEQATMDSMVEKILKTFCANG